jgi:hypothetical protein
LDILEKKEQELSGTPQPKLERKEAGKLRVKEYAPYVPETRDKLEADLLSRIQKIETSTNINFEGKGPDMGTIPIGSLIGGKKPSLREMSAIEAHEKGHFVRVYGMSNNHLAAGFDASAIQLSKADIEYLKEHCYQNMSEEEIPAEHSEYLINDMEVAERMSQLKNYFGMKGNEIFTANHLKYAREHYSQDTGIDNSMTQFFQAITPETEKEFLRLINSSGI